MKSCDKNPKYAAVYPTRVNKIVLTARLAAPKSAFQSINNARFRNPHKVITKTSSGTNFDAYAEQWKVVETSWAALSEQTSESVRTQYSTRAQHVPGKFHCGTVYEGTHRHTHSSHSHCYFEIAVETNTFEHDTHASCDAIAMTIDWTTPLFLIFTLIASRALLLNCLTLSFNCDR